MPGRRLPSQAPLGCSAGQEKWHFNYCGAVEGSYCCCRVGEMWVLGRAPTAAAVVRVELAC